MILFFVLIVVLILFSAIFSGSETAYFSLSKHHLKINKKLLNKYTYFMKEEYRFLLMLLVLNMITNVAITSIGDYVLKTEFSSFQITLIVTAVLLVFGEVLPKSISVNNQKFIINFSYPILRFFKVLLNPFLKLLNFIEIFFNNIPEIINPIKFNNIDYNQIVSVVTSKMEIDNTKRDLLINFHKLSNYSAKVIMIKLENRIDSSLAEEKHLKDVANIDQNYEIDIVSQHIRLDQLVKIYKEKDIRYFFVSDEYGTILGYIDLETVINEFDFFKNSKSKSSKGNLKISAQETIESLVDKNILNIPISSKYSSLNGFLLELFERIPKKNEKIEYDKYIFKILKVDKTKIVEVEIRYKGE